MLLHRLPYASFKVDMQLLVPSRLPGQTGYEHSDMAGQEWSCRADHHMLCKQATPGRLQTPGSAPGKTPMSVPRLRPASVQQLAQMTVSSRRQADLALTPAAADTSSAARPLRGETTCPQISQSVLCVHAYHARTALAVLGHASQSCIVGQHAIQWSAG